MRGTLYVNSKMFVNSVNLIYLSERRPTNYYLDLYITNICS